MLLAPHFVIGALWAGGLTLVAFRQGALATVISAATGGYVASRINSRRQKSPGYLVVTAIETAIAGALLAVLVALAGDATKLADLKQPAFLAAIGPAGLAVAIATGLASWLVGLLRGRLGGWKVDQLARALGQAGAFLVLVISLVLVVTPAVAALPSVLSEDPFKPHQVVTTVDKSTYDSGSGVTTKETTTTNTEASEDLLTRSLSSGGLLLLRIAVAGLAAFLAGAVIQRAVLGRFDIKVGPIELSELGKAAEAASGGIEKLSRRFTEVEKGLKAERTERRKLAQSAKAGLEALEDEIQALKPGQDEGSGVIVK